jgi:hypothetical protein
VNSSTDLQVLRVCSLYQANFLQDELHRLAAQMDLPNQDRKDFRDLGR